MLSDWIAVTETALRSNERRGGNVRFDEGEQDGVHLSLINDERREPQARRPLQKMAVRQQPRLNWIVAKA